MGDTVTRAVINSKAGVGEGPGWKTRSAGSRLGERKRVAVGGTGDVDELYGAWIRFEMSGGRLMKIDHGSVQEEEGERGLRWSGEGADFENVDSRIQMIGDGGDHQMKPGSGSRGSELAILRRDRTSVRRNWKRS